MEHALYSQIILLRPLSDTFLMLIAHYMSVSCFRIQTLISLPDLPFYTHICVQQPVRPHMTSSWRSEWKPTQPQTETLIKLISGA